MHPHKEMMYNERARTAIRGERLHVPGTRNRKITELLERAKTAIRKRNGRYLGLKKILSEIFALLSMPNAS